MKDFIYIDMLSQELKDTLSKKQAYSSKALKDGLWGISPDYVDFLYGVDVVFDGENNKLSFTYRNDSIIYDVIYNYNYVFKIKYLKNSNKLITNNFNSLYDILTNRKVDTATEKYTSDTIFQSAFKKLNGITFESLFVIERHHIKTLLKS